MPAGLLLRECVIRLALCGSLPQRDGVCHGSRSIEQLQQQVRKILQLFVWCWHSYLRCLPLAPVMKDLQI
jgi:hypothetical protein